MRVAIQGELGSNSHMAALAMLEDAVESNASTDGQRGSIDIVACVSSADVFECVTSGSVEGAVLPIENSLHGSVAEHYDLLLAQPVRIARESLLRIRHNLIVRPGVKMNDLRRALSHPVALSQCRRWFAAHPEVEAVNYYDTAGSAKHVVQAGLSDAAGIASELSAELYGGEILQKGIEDHSENYTRFHLLVREPVQGESLWKQTPGVNKASLAFSVAHRPGTLVLALEAFARSGVNLTKIESRPVPGMPWEYVFFVDLRFEASNQIDSALAGLGKQCEMVKELGRYAAA